MKSSQSNFNLRSPNSYSARSYLIATVIWKFSEWTKLHFHTKPKPKAKDCRNQRTWKLVDCKIYNSSTRGKSNQNQSTTPFGRCGLTLDWFTTREVVIDFVIHQLLGPLIHIPVWYTNNFTIMYMKIAYSYKCWFE